jgi:hypothetical protein
VDQPVERRVSEAKPAAHRERPASRSTPIHDRSTLQMPVALQVGCKIVARFEHLDSRAQPPRRVPVVPAVNSFWRPSWRTREYWLTL